MRYLFTLLFCLSVLSLKAQTFTGKIRNTDNEPVIYASVLIKDLSKPKFISEYTIARAGDYKIVLKKQYQGILIEVKSVGYLTKKYKVEHLEQKTYTIDFILEKDTVKIKEITVVADKAPFTVKEDTVTYNVSSYSDGTERKVEEVISKLPGIKVNEKTGEIKYKNRSVETVLLEGDNLFGYNYTLGTKNINVDMVEQIQAIENYSENPLLKGIEGGNKVVLNLILKKKKIDVSGNISLYGGLFNDWSPAVLSDNNLLGITKNYKSFASFSFNNIGMNNTPYDYFGGMQSIEQNKENDLLAQKIIPENSFSNDIDQDRTNINNQYFASYNLIFKIGKRIKIKSNLYYLNDDIKNNEIFQNLYIIDKDTFKTEDNKQINKMPVLYRGDLNIKINSSKTSLLEYDFSGRSEKINTPTDVLSNNENTYNSLLKTGNNLLKQKLLFTQKLSGRKALQISLQQSLNDLNQDYEISPSVFDSLNYDTDLQNAAIFKNYTNVNAILLGAANRNKYTVSAGWKLIKNDIKTNLTGKNNLGKYPFNAYANNLIFSEQSFYQTASYQANIKRWQITPAYNFEYLLQNRNDKLTDTVNNADYFLLKYSLRVKYGINNVSFLQATASYDKFTNNEIYSFKNPVLISNRTTVSNTPNLDLSQTWYYSLFYYYSNLYNQWDINAGINYSENTGKYFSEYFINEQVALVYYFFLPQNSNNLSFNFNVSKFIAVLSSKINFSSSYSVMQYYNVINSSNLRNNTGNNFNINFGFNTGFSFPFNFSNVITYNRLQSKSEDSKAFTTNFIENIFEIKIKFSKRSFASITTDYVLPNLNIKENNYIFIDVLCSISSKNKRWEYNIMANNLLNKNNFEQVQTTDYSIYSTHTSILQRHYMFGVSYSF